MNMSDIEEPPHDWNCMMKRNVTDDKRFGELVQQNDHSGKNHQLDIFIFEHVFVSKGSEVKGSFPSIRAMANSFWLLAIAAKSYTCLIGSIGLIRSIGSVNTNQFNQWN